MMISKDLYLFWNPESKYHRAGFRIQAVLAIALMALLLLLTDVHQSVAGDPGGFRKNISKSAEPHNHHLSVTSSEYAYPIQSMAQHDLDANESGLTETVVDTVPAPSTVLRKSMILPGWGQVENNQVWKVPVIYVLFAGLAYYGVNMHQKYGDYRAAYYNSQYPDGDRKFGATPDYIDPNTNPQSLRYNRNVYRNRRDLTFIGVALAYGLNLVDAYVFAHMRDFDVSDDLSANIRIQGPFPDDFPPRHTAPANEEMNTTGISLTLQLKLR